MPRSHRFDVANGLHHVTQRGLERRNIVLDDDDRSHWWWLFERVARRCQWRVFAVALLDGQVTNLPHVARCLFVRDNRRIHDDSHARHAPA